MDITTAKAWLRTRRTALLTAASRQRKWFKAGFVIAGVLVAGASELLSNAVPEPWRPYLYTTWFIGLLLAFLGGLWAAFVDEQEPETLVRAEQAIEQVEERAAVLRGLEADFHWFSTLYLKVSVLREFLEQVSISGPGNSAERLNRLGAMLDVLMNDKEILFGINDERWNFAIYLYDEDTGLLECAVCRRPTRGEENAVHRSSRPGVGHVGLAFQTKRAIIAADTSDGEARALFDAPPDSRREDDRERYRSIASIPIRMQEEEPIGVVVGTSDRLARFRVRQKGEDTVQDPVEPLRILAAFLAMLHRTIHLYGKGEPR